MQSLPQRLLVVEDDVTVARALSRTLARRGFSVAIVRSCAAARELSQPFDFAVLDLDLPDGNGVDLAESLLAAGRVPGVLFFTGTSNTALLARARRIGRVITKSSGSSEVLAFLTHDLELAAPESRTAPSPRAHGFRVSSGTLRTGSLASKSRAR